MAHLVRACLVVAAVITATFLPFIAGGYDPLAAPLSEMAWALGRIGLLLAPIGGLWLWASANSVKGLGPSRWLRRTTIGTCGFIAFVMVVMAFACSGPLLAVSAATIAGLLLIRLVHRLRSAESGLATSRMAAASMAVAPIVIFAIQSALVDPVTNYGRDRVIANSAPLIAEIERYHARHGAYPVSIFALYGDVKPAVVGVQRYYYEPSSDAYNLIFEEPSPAFGLRRFVVYNPRDKQRLTVHETERLLLDEAGLDADNAGYTVVQPLPQPHWKAFLFLS